MTVRADGALAVPFPVGCRTLVLDASPYEPLLVEASVQQDEIRSLGAFTLHLGAALHVHVVRDPGEIGARGALVRIFSAPTRGGVSQRVVVADANANDDGRATLTALPADRELLVEARDAAGGDLSATQIVTLRSGETTQLDPLVLPEPAQLSMRPRFTAAFRAEFHDARIANVLLERTEPNGSRTRLAQPPDANGAAAFDRLRPGRWEPTVMVEAAGTIQPVPLEPIELAPGESRERSPELEVPVFHGIVRHGSEGVEAMISVAGETGAVDVKRSVRSGADGRFVLLLPAAGVFDVTVIPVRELIESPIGEVDFTNPARPVIINLPDGSIVAKASDPAGPVAGVTVTASRLHDGRGDVRRIDARATSDAKGEARFESLPAGTWAVRARDARGRAAEKQVTLGDTDALLVELALDSAPAVEGTLRDAAGNADAGARVACIARDAGGIQVTASSTAADGTFRLELPRSTAASAVCGAVTVRGDALTFSGRTDVRAQLTTSPLPGTVTFADWPAAASPNRYWLVSADGGAVSLWTAAEALQSFHGPLSLRLPPGSWSVVQLTSTRDWAALASGNMSGLATPTSFAVAAGQNVKSELLPKTEERRERK